MRYSYLLTFLNKSALQLYIMDSTDCMKKKGCIVGIAVVVFVLQACKENPHNTFGGPSNIPQDTASTSRDTSSIGTRSDR